jgi:hypothetical protein
MLLSWEPIARYWPHGLNYKISVHSLETWTVSADPVPTFQVTEPSLPAATTVPSELTATAREH